MLCKARWTVLQVPALGCNALTAWTIDQGESPVQETHLHFSHSAGKVKQKVEALSLIIMLHIPVRICALHHGLPTCHSFNMSVPTAITNRHKCDCLWAQHTKTCDPGTAESCRLQPPLSCLVWSSSWWGVLSVGGGWEGRITQTSWWWQYIRSSTKYPTGLGSQCFPCLSQFLLCIVLSFVMISPEMSKKVSLCVILPTTLIRTTLLQGAWDLNTKP